MSDTLIDQFDAMDVDENIVTICQYQAVVPFRGLSGSTSYAKGAKRFALSNGRPVNATSDANVFEIVDTGKLVHRISEGG